MNGAKEYLQVKFLRTLEPLGSLSVDKLEDIASKSQVEDLPPGRVVFRQGEKDSRSTYLLSGQLELQITGNPRAETLKAKTTEARYPVAQEWPRPSTCRTKTNVTLLHIDSNLLEILLSEDPSGTYEVTEIGVQEDPESDWMLRFLQSPAFLQLPTENIQSILIHLEEVPMQAGEVVIKQGDSDDWYYIVKQGKCSVSRRPAPKAEEVRLAILGPGDGFGEEALITDGKRNATVTMKEAGVLMRLSKQDFHRLLVDPMLQAIDHATMMDKVKTGAALIDVRTNKEFNEDGIKGAQNIPLSMLRVKAKDLNSTREHIVYCNDMTQSRAAAFLLAQQSLQVYVLEGGLHKQSKPFSPATKSTTPTSHPAPTETAKTPITPIKPELEEIIESELATHKHQVEQQVKKADAAEQARQSASAKTSQLKVQADALRAQADNLARKTASAEEEKRRAEQEKRAAQAEIDALKKETLKERDEILSSVKQEVAREKEMVRQKEEEASRLRTEAEQARQRAEQELARIKAEAEAVAKQQNELESQFKRAETEKQKAEREAQIARVIAQQEAEKVKAEAEAIRNKALEEAERLRAELEARKVKMAEDFAHHEKEARRKADQSAAEASKAAEDARRQAAMEADAIRKQALKEAENLRIQIQHEKQQAAEQLARSKAEEQLRRQELEAERQKALEDARKTAEQEAETIRKQALQEAQLKAREEARRQAEQEAEEARQRALQEAEEARKKMIDEFSRKAMETAQLEAEAIRQEALEEANRLRSELEQTRQLVESEAKRAQARLAEETARRQAEESDHARAAEEAARLAAEQAERRRAEQEAQAAAIAEEQARLAAEQEEQQRIAEEQARIAAQVEQQRKAEQEAIVQRQAEQQREHAEEEKTQKAKQMAEQLRSKLDKQESEKQDDEYDIHIGRGPKLAKAKLHVVKGKTILEGEEDIFIFKAPSERPPSRDEAEQLLKQAEQQFAEKSRKELPSFDIEYADEEPESEFVIEQESEFSDSILVELDNITTKSTPSPRSQQFNDDFTPVTSSDAPVKKKRSSLIALAASVVVMVGVSIIAITRPTYTDTETVAETTNASQPTRGLASIRARTENHKEIIEERMRSEAEKEFNEMLSDWRKQKK
jgi:CRP-like cAMP-binding protein